MTSNSPRPSRIEKLKRIPDTHKIRKRPPLRPAIPSPYTNSSSHKVIYVSSETPFMSAVKRVRHLLALADKRALGRVNLELKTSSHQLLRALEEEKARKEKGNGEAVIIKGTGQAIDRVMQLALYFQGQSDCRIQLRTGSLKVIDDIVEKDDIEEVDQDDAAVANAEEVPEYQVRSMSVLEVAVMLR